MKFYIITTKQRVYKIEGYQIKYDYVFLSSVISEKLLLKY